MVNSSHGLIMQQQKWRVQPVEPLTIVLLHHKKYWHRLSVPTKIGKNNMSKYVKKPDISINSARMVDTISFLNFAISEIYIYYSMFVRNSASFYRHKKSCFNENVSNKWAHNLKKQDLWYRNVWVDNPRFRVFLRVNVKYG